MGDALVSEVATEQLLLVKYKSLDVESYAIKDAWIADYIIKLFLVEAIQKHACTGLGILN